MPLIQIEANLTAGQLLKAVEQMPSEDLDRFVDKVVALRASRHAPRLSRPESELMEKINRGLDPKDQERYDELVAKREVRDLSQDENDDFLRLTHFLEAWNVERMEALAELARFRGSTLRDLMRDLGIGTLSHA